MGGQEGAEQGQEDASHDLHLIEDDWGSGEAGWLIRVPGRLWSLGRPVR